MAISITITADTQEEAIHQINGLADLVKQGAESLYFQKGTPRGRNSITLVRTDNGNDYVLGGHLDKVSPDATIQTGAPQDAPETVSETPQESPKIETKKSSPKEEKPAEKPSEGHSANDVKPLLLLLARREHKDDVKKILGGFSASNFREFAQMAKDRDDGAEMTEKAYELASAKVKEYDLKEE